MKFESMHQLIKTASTSFIVLAPAAEVSEVQMLVGDGIQVRPLEMASDSSIIQRSTNGRALAVDGAMTYLGVISTSRAGASVVQDNHEEISLLVNGKVEHLDLSDRASSDRLADARSWCVRVLISVAAELSIDVSNVRRAMVTLRLEHEDMLKRFTLLESYASHFSTPQRISKLHLRHSGDSVALVSVGTVRGRLRQILPTQALGISGVEIFILGPLVSQEGTLTVSLFIDSSKSAIYEWSTAARDLVQGANTFLLDKALQSGDRDPTLEIRWSGSAPLELALSLPNPVSALCAVIEGQPRLSAPIALKVWGGIPGSDVLQTAGPSFAAMPAGSQIPEEPITFALGAGDLQGVTMISPGSPALAGRWWSSDHLITTSSSTPIGGA